MKRTYYAKETEVADLQKENRILRGNIEEKKKEMGLLKVRARGSDRRDGRNTEKSL